MNARRLDPGQLSPAQKDALIRDLRRQVSGAQSEIRLLKRRLGLAEQARAPSQQALLDKLREASPRPSSEASPGISSKLGRGLLDLWRSPIVLGAVALILAAFAVDGAIGI